MLVVPKGHVMFARDEKMLELTAGIGVMFLFMGPHELGYFHRKLEMLYVLLHVPSLKPVFCNIEELYKLKCVASVRRQVP